MKGMRNTQFGKSETGKSLLLDSAIFLLLICLCSYTIAVLSFFAGVTIRPWMFPAGAILAFFIWWFGFVGSNKNLLVKILVAVGVFAGSILCACLIYDISWDGNTYHKTAVGLLMDGWNPLHTDCMEGLSEDWKTGGMQYNAQWINHYANGGWVLAATIAAAVGNIEAGKSINLIFMVAVFMVLFWYLQQKSIRTFGAIVISLLAVCNPITVSQVESFYVDGDLYLCLLLAVISMLMLGELSFQSVRRTSLFLLFFAIVFAINLKFTGAVYVGAFCIAVYLCWLVLAARKQQLFKVFWKSSVLFGGMALVAVLFYGSSSYVCNFLEKGNPLYPLVGEGKADIMAYSEPNGFAGKSETEKSLRSLFAKTDNSCISSAGGRIQEKLPFTVSFAEIKCGRNTDTRAAGMGPLFSGLFLVALGIDVCYLWKMRKKDGALALQLFGVLLASALIFLFVPGSWWMRYSAHIYFYVILAGVAVVQWVQDRLCKSRVVAAAILRTLLVVNTGIFVLSPAMGVYRSKEIRKDQQLLQAASRDFDVAVSSPIAHMTGVFWNLKQWEVRFTVKETLEQGQMAYGNLLMWDSSAMSGAE